MANRTCLEILTSLANATTHDDLLKEFHAHPELHEAFIVSGGWMAAMTNSRLDPQMTAAYVWHLTYGRAPRSKFHGRYLYGLRESLE